MAGKVRMEVGGSNNVKVVVKALELLLDKSVSDQVSFTEKQTAQELLSRANRRLGSDENITDK